MPSARRRVRFPLVKLALWITPEQRVWLDQIAAEAGVSRSGAARELIGRAIEGEKGQ